MNDVAGTPVLHQITAEELRSIVGGSVVASPNPGSSDFLAIVSLYAGTVSDLESSRIRAENRLRALVTEPMEGEKGGTFGLGFDTDHDEVKRLTAMVDGLSKIERAAIRELERAVALTPYGDWVAATRGVGAKTVGRLLGAIGDPGDREMPSQLWAYCGLHVVPDPDQSPPPDEDTPVVGVAPRRRKGTQANWSTEAKKRVYLVAEACMKAGTNPYRDEYDRGKAKYAEVTHAAVCAPCKAAVGDALKPGHIHMRSMRLAMKKILLDMWKIAHDEAL